jgi:hypothetical protein
LMHWIRTCFHDNLKRGGRSIPLSTPIHWCCRSI